ncbi:extracellular solute-binding protein [Paenibacillus faecis]|uniref:Extracellular solute-binding protein n=1 Tax=Paenibacillus faecis TaxID=862114 RepID=A0A5D0CR74_9BACL|nr:extracellular solute-binding protein [Paenibacillus faecis]TYA12262.1 extracellular solute-binding protein [Paenibacillus faecis]
MAPTKMKLRYLTQFDPMRDLLDAKTSFEQTHPEVEISIEQAADNFESMQVFKSGECPDIMDGGGWYLFNQKGLFVDLMPFVEREPGLADDLQPGIMRVARKDGNLPGLPIDIALPLMVIHKEMFEKAGVPLPSDDWTWDEMIEMAKQLTIRDEDGIATQFGLGIGQDIEEIEPFILRNGGRYLSPDGSTTLGYADSPASIEAMQRVIDAFRVHRVTRKPGEPSKAGDLHEGFAIALGYTWYVGNLIRFGLDGRFQIVRLPRMPRAEEANMIYMGAAGITTKCEHPELAWQFLKHYILERPERFRQTQTLPLTKSLASDSGMTEHPIWAKFIEELDHVQASGFYLNEKWNSSRQLINEEIQRMILNEADVAQTMRSWSRYA